MTTLDILRRTANLIIDLGNQTKSETMVQIYRNQLDGIKATAITAMCNTRSKKKYQEFLEYMDEANWNLFDRGVLLLVEEARAKKVTA